MAMNAVQLIENTISTTNHTRRPTTKEASTTVACLKSEPIVLDSVRREVVEKAIAETCQFRKWKLLALSIRTNHVHVVVSVRVKKPSVALGALKANATRLMREDGCWTFDHSPGVD